MTAPSRSPRGFCTAFLSYKIGFLLVSPSVRESAVLLPGNSRLWGHSRKGTKTIFEKFSKVGKCHIRSPLALIFLGLEGGRA